MTDSDDLLSRIAADLSDSEETQRANGGWVTPGDVPLIGDVGCPLPFTKDSIERILNAARDREDQWFAREVRRGIQRIVDAEANERAIAASFTPPTTGQIAAELSLRDSVNRPESFAEISRRHAANGLPDVMQRRHQGAEQDTPRPSRVRQWWERISRRGTKGAAS